MLDFSHAIILDFEATCDRGKRPQPQEIIEFPSVLLALDTLKVVDEFEAFVRPFHHPVLSEFCTDLTSISQNDVDAAQAFAAVFDDYRLWLAHHDLSEQNAIFVTCGDWDLGTMLPEQCRVSVPMVEYLPPVITRWQNVKHAFCLATGRNKAPGMAGMLKELDLPLIGHHHRGMDDCRNIAEIYRKLLTMDAVPAVTANLATGRYPPVTVELRYGNRTHLGQLEARTLKALFGLAGRLFKRQPDTAERSDGSRIETDADLTRLQPGEVLHLTD